MPGRRGASQAIPLHLVVVMILVSRLIVPICLAIFGVVYFLEAGNIRTLYSQGPIGPDGVPKMFAIALGLALLGVVVIELRRPRAKAAPIDWGGFLAAVLVIVASAAYVALFRVAGYAIATALYALVLLAIFSRAKIRPLAAVLQTAGLVALVYLFFVVLFDVRLPQGPSLDTFFGQAPPPEATPAESAQ